MTKVKMTIHRALAELKLIDAKINKQTQEIAPVAIRQKGKLINGHIEENVFNASAISKYDSVTALIGRKGAIKSAIVKSNGSTYVTIGGKSMTVADAINEKSAIVFKKNLAENLKAKLKTVVAGLNTQNEVVTANAEKIVIAAYGKESVNNKVAEVTTFLADYHDKNDFVLADPLKLQEKIDVLEKEVEDFAAEVDACLSESNAITIIEA